MAAGLRPRAVVPPPPPCAPQFREISRSWDPAESVYAAKILPGEYYVTTAGEMICTVLGSCVSACIRDAAAGIGGMNHFMLPSSDTGTWANSAASAATRYGNFAMEHLINDMLKLGARRERLEFKLVGGGKVLRNLSDVGARNIEFVRNFLRVEGYSVQGEDLGGDLPRKVQYLPATGKVRVRAFTTSNNNSIAEREQRYLRELEKAPVGGDVELF